MKVQAEGVGQDENSHTDFYFADTKALLFSLSSRRRNEMSA